MLTKTLQARYYGFYLQMSDLCISDVKWITQVGQAIKSRAGREVWWWEGGGGRQGWLKIYILVTMTLTPVFSNIPAFLPPKTYKHNVCDLGLLELICSQASALGGLISQQEQKLFVFADSKRLKYYSF